MDNVRKCRFCQIEKSFSEFHKRKNGKFKIEATCKECRFIKSNKNPVRLLSKTIFPKDVKQQRELKSRYNSYMKCIFSREYNCSPKINLHKDKLFPWLESQFTSEMNWENRNKIWVVDHIIPTSFFDLTNEEELKMCYHYTNLQPILVQNNKDKSDYLPNGELARHYRHVGPIKFTFFESMETKELNLNKFVTIKNKYSKFYNLRGQILKFYDDDLFLVKIIKSKSVYVLSVFYKEDLTPIVLYKNSDQIYSPRVSQIQPKSGHNADKSPHSLQCGAAHSGH